MTKREQRLLVIDDLRRQAGGLGDKASAATAAAAEAAYYAALVAGARDEAEQSHAGMDRAAKRSQLLAKLAAVDGDGVSDSKAANLRAKALRIGELPPGVAELNGAGGGGEHDVVAELRGIHDDTTKIANTIHEVGGME